MGYYKYLGDHDLTIKAENFDAVLQRWREFEADNVPYPSASVFHEYPNDLPVLVPKTVPMIFEEMGFEVAFDDEAMTIEGWDGKAHDEEDYIRAIANLIEPGWFLDWTGEDDERWRLTATETTTGETVYIKPSLNERVTELREVLSRHDIVTPLPVLEAVEKFLADLT